MSTDVIDKLEINLRELYANNEKLLVVDICRKQLEEEVKEAREKYGELSKEHMDLNKEMKNLADYAKDKLQVCADYGHD